MPKKTRKRTRRVDRQELKLNEDPFLLDDPGGSALEWIDLSVASLREAVRRGEDADPWQHASLDSDALTERRRRKLESLSLNRDDEQESVA